MLKFSLAASIVAASLAGAAYAGPDYQQLKKCLSGCIDTTPPGTWARAWCGADCVLDYADSKLSLHASFGSGSSGWGIDTNGHPSLTWGTIPAAQVAFVVTQTPLNLPINRIEFRLMNLEHRPETGGILLAAVPGNNRTQGAFSAIIQNNPATIGQGGYLVAEIHYAGVADVDDAGEIIVQVGTPPCPADFNGDGAVDFFDYDEFVQAFEAGLPSSDFNGDGAVDFFDYDDFVTAFESGC